MARPLAITAFVVALLVGIPILLSQGDDSGAQEIEAIEETSTSATSPTTVASSLVTTPTTGDAVSQTGQLLAAEEAEGEDTATTQLGATSSTSEVESASPAEPRAANPEPDSTGEAASAPAPSSSTTAPTTTAPSTTEAPTTTAPPTTAAPTTAPVSTGPGPEAPSTVPGGQAPTDKPSVDLPPSEEDPTPIPVGPESETAEGEPTAEQWQVLRQCESGNNYSIVSSNGLYHGAYQFHPDTWDSVARSSGNTNLVGVLPSVAAPSDQDLLALELWRSQGWGPWPTCGKKAAAA